MTWFLDRSRLRLDEPIIARVARGVAWVATGVLVARVATLLSSVVAARGLTQEGFGTLGIVQSTLSMFQVVASLGLGLATTKFIAEAREQDPERAGRRLGLCLVTSAVFGTFTTGLLAALSPQLASVVLGNPDLAQPFALSAPALAITALGGVVLGGLAGLEAFRQAAKAQALGGVGVLVCTALVVPVWGLTGAIVSLIAGAAVQVVYGGLLLRRELHRRGIAVRLQSFEREGAAVLGFSVPATAASLVTTPAMWASHALLFRTPGGVNEMAVLSAANQWFAALSFIPVIIAQPLITVLAERLGANDIIAVKRLMRTAVKATALMVLPCSGTVIVASPVVMASYGAQYRDGWPVLIGLAIAAALLAIQSPVGQLVVAAGRMWLGFSMNAAWGLALLAGTLLLLERGAMGLALARCAAYAAHLVWSIAAASLILRAVARTNATSRL